MHFLYCKVHRGDINRQTRLNKTKQKTKLKKEGDITQSNHKIQKKANKTKKKHSNPLMFQEKKTAY